MQGQGPSIEPFSERDISTLLCDPHVLAALIEACLNQASYQNLADLVLQDAALSAQVIQAASKAIPQAIKPAEPVSSAVQKLGIPILTSLALKAAQQISKHRFTAEELTFQARLWATSQVGAVAARCLAPSVDFSRIEEAQLGGLFLNLGIHLLFARFGRDYLVMNVGPCGSTAQALLERGRFGLDHLELADRMIRSWKLESFLADAIRFLQVDVSQIEHCGSLLKIARLARQFCPVPQALPEELPQLAERLFGLSASETHYLFKWAQGLYPASVALLDDAEALQADFSQNLDHLQELTFILAKQEAARARLAQIHDQEQLLSTARRLYLEYSPAAEVIFFLLDQKSRLLTGLQITGQQSLVRELEIPLQKEFCLLSKAVADTAIVSSFGAEKEFTVTDHLISRLCGDQGFVCYPLSAGEQPLGAVVLAVDSPTALAPVETLQLKTISQVVGDRLAALAPAAGDPFNDGAGLLRRVSHEVNNPLTIIGNYAEVLSRSDSAQEHAKLTAAIKGEVRRVDDIISYYLHRQEAPDFLDQGVDLNELIRETVESLHDSVLKSGKIELQLNLQEELEKLEASPVLIKQVLVNLIRNAAEALESGGIITLTTRVNFVAGRGWQAEIMVADNGPGMSPRVLKHLFRPVASSKGAGHSGVGLSIVKSMIDDLGGQVSCYSNVAVGTSFQVQIPYGSHFPLALQEPQ